jgi:hypothetical protein
MPDNHTYAEASDEKLITATLKRDTSCFGAIVERYWAMAVAFSNPRRHTGDDRVPVAFKKGSNQLVVKIQNRSGPWAFSCRLLESEAAGRESR